MHRLHMACRHRCLKLVVEAGNVGPRQRCPYHSWLYGLNGELRSTPHLGGPGHHGAPGFDPANHGLIPVNCIVWHDWIFVNLGREPSDFDIDASPLKDRLSGVDLGKITLVATLYFGEVRAICERIHQGKASHVAETGGVPSPHWEDSVRRFQELALAAVP